MDEMQSNTHKPAKNTFLPEPEAGKDRNLSRAISDKLLDNYIEMMTKNSKISQKPRCKKENSLEQSKEQSTSISLKDRNRSEKHVDDLK